MQPIGTAARRAMAADGQSADGPTVVHQRQFGLPSRVVIRSAALSPQSMKVFMEERSLDVEADFVVALLLGLGLLILVQTL